MTSLGLLFVSVSYRIVSTSYLYRIVSVAPQDIVGLLFENGASEATETTVSMLELLLNPTRMCINAATPA